MKLYVKGTQASTEITQHMEWLLRKLQEITFKEARLKLAVRSPGGESRMKRLEENEKFPPGL